MTLDFGITDLVNGEGRPEPIPVDDVIAQMRLFLDEHEAFIVAQAEFLAQRAERIAQLRAYLEKAEVVCL